MGRLRDRGHTRIELDESNCSCSVLSHHSCSSQHMSILLYNESYKKNMRASAALKACARLFASAWGRRYVRSFRSVRRSV